MNITELTYSINEYVMELKKNQEKNIKDFNLIDFKFSFPYSSQVQDLIVDLVRRCVIDQTDEGYRLSSLGKKLVRDLK